MRHYTMRREYAQLSRFGAWLRGRLDARKMPQHMLATQLGVKPATVSHLMGGVSTPERKHILPIAKMFDVPAEEILKRLD